MTEWCLEHPWMTFVILMTLVMSLPAITVIRRSK